MQEIINEALEKIQNGVPVLWVNRKTKEKYVAFGKCTNATNAQDGQAMISYFKHDANVGNTFEVYVRAADEFFEKFDLAEG